MRIFLYTSAALLLLTGCNTIDGFGKDMGAVGQSFAGMFDNSVQNSRRIRDNSDYIMSGPGGPPPPAMYGGGQGGYGGGQMGYGGGGYGGGQMAYGGNDMGGMPSQYPPYYQQQPRQPAMPYYYNEGY